ncbi:UDP-galactopyranose mutase [Micromonospora sp. NPDC049559]|uniref:UDP-galactopyranose mutase n=1 Tax=Micromonospora sp. NPDC049559 TaxID=3155923 RepID=UPI00342D14B4
MSQEVVRAGALPAVAVVGAGWSGVVAARTLYDAGCRVHVFERDTAIGGHSRAGFLNGVLFEPEGPHIFHTSNADVAAFVRRFGMTDEYMHRGLTEIFLSDSDEDPQLLSWPPQVDELKLLPIWPDIELELSRLPVEPSTADLESYCLSIMGRTLYRLFIEGYSIKQWGKHPAELSQKFAPGRLDLRTDGNRRLFRDRWEYFPARGAQEIIENIARPLPATFGESITVRHLEALEVEFDAIVITGALDEFVGRPDELEWRGIRTVNRYIPLEDPSGTVTAGYIVNQPSLRRPYTRTVESKHATGQSIRGTVVTEEYPGHPARHYPVLTVDGRNELANERIQAEIRESTRMAVHFCGRLANYTYINQDVAIEQGFSTARECLDGMRR